MLEDIVFLKRIRGKFSDTKSARWSEYFYMSLFGVVMPTLFGFILWHDSVPVAPLSSDELALVLLIPGSLFLGWVFWYNSKGEYEFTGSRVIYRCRGKLRRTIELDSVLKVDIQPDNRGYSRLLLRGSGKPFSILLYPSIQAEIAAMSTERTTESRS